MSEDKVLYEVDDRVAVVTLNRPDRLNAMDADVFRLLTEHARRAAADPQVRAVVVRGEGRSFSSGLDISLFGQQASEDGVPRIDIESLQRAFTVYEECPKPTVAAVQGHALGGALQLAIACDIRIAATDAVFSAAEVRWGIIPDLGATQRLPRLIGLGRAKEMVLTGRNVTADEAGHWGLVNRICEPDALLKEAMSLASQLAVGPPLALAAAKRLTGSALDRPVAEGLDREAQAQRTLLASQDFREAVTAGFEKRAPAYQGR
ncbi:MAG TPA: enoyl-CoA hydratase-related protein [Actinomycetota bacterium]|nr:enoyl-CoA hydratase-related protein [Actinomycetota bacterium]